MNSMVALVASAFVVASLPAEAETVFRGQIVWTDAKNCPNARRGDENRSQFHPLIAGNDAFAAITTVYNFGGNSFRPKGARTSPRLSRRWKPAVSDGPSSRDRKSRASSPS